MSLEKGTNSYCTVEEADAYFADRLDVDAWMTASEIQKPQSLIVATSILEEYPWMSCVVDENQPLAFPRVGVYFDPRVGYDVALSVVPDRVVKATFELAYHLLNNDGLQDDSGSVKELQIGTIKLIDLKSPNGRPATVTRLTKPLLINRGQNVVWRAN